MLCFHILQLSQWYSLKKALFYSPFETGKKAVWLFFIIFLILFHVMVSLTLIFCLALCLFWLEQFNYPKFFVLPIPDFFRHCQVKRTIKMATWGISLTEDYLQSECILLKEIWETNGECAVRHLDFIAYYSK